MFDVPNKPLAHAVLLGDVSLLTRSRSDRQDLRFGKLVHRMLGATGISPFGLAVRIVFGRGPYKQMIRVDAIRIVATMQ